ncbi:aldehyde dehydrogenase family protein [Terrabacter sp. MAHUQ-38]|uniref:aldehyde dehydrogenase family protein n=1 Tax=unclassified Terrabacter TaxID=2630222 RepID=UPI00351CB275
MTATPTHLHPPVPVPVDDVVARAQRAFDVLPDLAPAVRAAALDAAAGALAEHADELIAVARDETGLLPARLAGELRRTRVQLGLFARVVEQGTHLDARVDEADPDFALGVPRDDLRRVMLPVGPVLVFAASNFPFAFSVAGGDTASALAAGCPVVVKAHPGHPRLSRRVADLVARALVEAGLPDAVLQLVEGQQTGVEVLRHPGIHAASFTGSVRAGRILTGVAASRPRPIPFFGELGSVNPVVVTADALSEGGDGLLRGYVTSVSGSAGQLCTKPGFLLVPEGSVVDPVIAQAASEVPEHRLLNAAIADGYVARRAAVLATDGVRVVHGGSVRRDDDGQAWVTPTFVAVSLATLRNHSDALLDEAFGPLSIVVEVPARTDLADVVAELFPGNLTSTVHRGAGEIGPHLDRLARVMARTSGRVLFRGWPTGVAVTPAMHHAGPWPATTTDATSVGTAAVGRFLRGVAFQGAPQELVPVPLRDDNPWNVPRSSSPAGESARW